MLNSLIFTRSSTVPMAHIAPAVVAVFVEAIDAGNLTAADVVAVVGDRQSLGSSIGCWVLVFAHKK